MVGKELDILGTLRITLLDCCQSVLVEEIPGLKLDPMLDQDPIYLEDFHPKIELKEENGHKQANDQKHQDRVHGVKIDRFG